MPSKSKPVRLDGTTLEGGGQILRLALALSSLTGQGIQLEKIRGNRGTKKQDGGIKQSHLGGLAWLARATDAATEGMVLRSRDLLFEPERGTAHEIKEAQKVVTRNGVTLRPELVKFAAGSKPAELEPLWTDIVEKGQLKRRETSVALTTPGSVFAILQAILPFLLFRSQRDSDSNVPLRITIHGGTNVWHSMSFEWAEHVLFPQLHTKLGIGPISMDLHERSWSTGTRSIGSVSFMIPPLNSATPLPAFHFTDRGAVTRIAVFVYTPSAAWQRCLLECVQALLEQRLPDIPVEVATDAPSGHPARLYLLLVAHTANGYRLGRDLLHAEKLVESKREKIAEKVATGVVRDLIAELAHGGCVDEYLHDQLVVFQTLAQGKSTVHRPGEPSLHTQTARWVASEICGVTFDDDGACEGIGYCPVEKVK